MANGLRSRCAVTALLGLALATLLTGCVKTDPGKGQGADSKVTRANFERTRDGMPEKEVKEILGEPTEVKDVDGGKMKQLIWKNGNDSITIDIKDGKVFTRQSMFITIR